MKRFFLVDDDPLFRGVVAGVAASCGAAFEGFERARDLWARLSVSRPDVLMVDGLLPDTDGLKLIRALRAAPDPVREILFVSAFFQDLRSFQTLKALGVEKILHKPLSGTALRAELAPILVEAPMAKPAIGRMDGFTSEVARLGERFARELPSMADELEHAVRTWTGGGGGGREQLLGFLHRLAGTAGMMGHDHLSTRATDLHAAVADATRAPALATLLAELARLMRRASPSPAARLVAKIEVAGWLRTVLLVARDPFVGRGLRASFSLAAVELRPVITASEALDAITRRAPDVLVLDESCASDGALPVELVRLAASMPRGTPLVFLGGPERTPFRHQAESIAGATWVDRPVTGDDLLAAIGRAATRAYRGLRVIVVGADGETQASLAGALAPLGIAVDAATDLDALARVPTGELPQLLLVRAESVASGRERVAASTKLAPALRELPVFYLTEDAVGDQALAWPVAPARAAEQIPRALKETFLARAWSFCVRSWVVRDALTGLTTRDVLADHIASLLTSLAGEEPSDVDRRPGLLLLEVEGLVGIRRFAGELTANRALKEVGTLLDASLGWGDFVARWSDRQFLLIVADARAAVLDDRLAALRAELEKRPVYGPKGFELEVTLTAAATGLSPRDTVATATARVVATLAGATTNGRLEVAA